MYRGWLDLCVFANVGIVDGGFVDKDNLPSVGRLIVEMPNRGFIACLSRLQAPFWQRSSASHIHAVSGMQID